MSDRMTIRIAEERDIPIITEFNCLMAWETEEKALDAATALAGARAIIEDPARGFYLVAELDGEMIGQLMVTKEWSDWRNKFFLWIQSVYVRPEFRGRKIFSRLFHYLLQMFKENGEVAGFRLYVERNNTGAKAVYEALGMSTTIYDLYELATGHDSPA